MEDIRWVKTKDWGEKRLCLWLLMNKKKELDLLLTEIIKGLRVDPGGPVGVDSERKWQQLCQLFWLVGECVTNNRLKMEVGFFICGSCIIIMGPRDFVRGEKMWKNVFFLFFILYFFLVSPLLCEIPSTFCMQKLLSSSLQLLDHWAT